MYPKGYTRPAQDALGWLCATVDFHETAKCPHIHGVERSPLRVLLIEDDEDSRTLFAEVLEEAQMHVTSALPDALPKPDSFRIVVTDLPGHSAYSNDSALAWIDQLKTLFSVPIVVLTGRHEATHDDALKSAAILLRKPIDIEELVSAVRKAAQT